MSDLRTTVRTIDVHLEVPFAISRHVRTEKRVVLLEVDDGTIVARGEASADPYFGETSEQLERELRAAVMLLPRDPADLGDLRARLDQRFPHGGAASCAIDIAAHDRAAQHAGVPLRGYFGLGGREAPPTSFTIGLASPAVMAERASLAVARGFGVLKVKLGREDDVLILRAIRERCPAVIIRVDPNGAWTPEEAPGRIEQLATFGLEFVEQPVPPDDLAGLRAVHERSAVPIVADEAAVRVADVDRLAGCCAGINVKLQKSGGLFEARAMVARAHALGLKVMLGCRAAETSVGIAAAAHLAPAVEWADLDGNLLIVDDPFVAVPVEGGRFRFSERPGLGAVARA